MLFRSNPDLMSGLVACLGSSSLSTAPPAQSQGEIRTEIEQVTKRYEEEKRRPPRSLAATPRVKLINAWKLEREQREQRENTAGAIMIYQTYCGVTKRYSFTPLSELKPSESLRNPRHMAGAC